MDNELPNRPLIGQTAQKIKTQQKRTKVGKIRDCLECQTQTRFLVTRTILWWFLDPILLCDHLEIAQFG
jgi:hypothetical protein